MRRSRFQPLEVMPEQKIWVRKGLDKLGLYYNQNKNTRDTEGSERYYGYLGEVVVCDILGVPRPSIDNNGDCGTDISYNGIKIDVKCRMCRTTPDKNYVVKAYKHQIDKADDNTYLLFLFYHPVWDTFFVGGITTVLGFRTAAKLYGVGDSVAGLYKVNTPQEEQYCIECGSLAVCELPVSIQDKGGSE